MWFFSLGLGLVLGVLAMLMLLVRARREADRIDEQRQVLAQENRIVLDFMHQMAEALADNPSRTILYQRIVHAAILSTGALSACIFEKTSDGQMRGAALEGLFPPHRPLPEVIRDKLTTRAKFIEQVLRSETFPVGDGIVGRVAETGRGEIITDAAADPRIVRHDDPALAIKSVIAVPLIFRDRFFGVLAVTNPADGLPFSATDFSLVQSLAEQAALALHNAEFLNFQIEKSQLDLDLSLASGIQKMLLPRSAPRVAGLDVDARYLPAQKIGGDLYDLFALSDTRLGVAVADVSGKGIPASLLMAICRANLRQIAPRHTSPASVLIELNRVLSGDLHREMFVTMTYAVVDAAAGTVTFARAGHELTLFVRRDRATAQYASEFTGGEGMPLGMVDETLFADVITDRVDRFDAGDVLVLYTDGVTEAPNEEDKEFSGSRLADVVRTLRDRSAREINDGILENVRRFSEGVEQRDDFTLVTVKRG
ncbi:MAG TPA: GAF domain-containing SpoIIE family protein phosphatase [Opitutaceae bacterium]|nr:GAF domain-containing SpoIIE family protein phosphatase [Opitutaceae bacterium]